MIVGNGSAESDRVGREVVRKSIVNCAFADVVRVGRRARTEKSVSGVS